ncbi:hypothetical protein GPJ56_002732 [Histomonas meleagridis]|uniref:uncharacterized protein n=1 Tax=Histomonas meleagridis TaxID=135588 RepID=UPI00355A6453|nr:hypothetical protein GPJ56_002732 [Histomonas meleagridis]KAH0800039.1 hypothetical protein GO595_007151 [Histomonas meleagridis]
MSWSSFVQQTLDELHTGAPPPDYFGCIGRVILKNQQSSENVNSFFEDISSPTLKIKTEETLDKKKIITNTSNITNNGELTPNKENPPLHPPPMLLESPVSKQDSDDSSESQPEITEYSPIRKSQNQSSEKGRDSIASEIDYSDISDHWKESSKKSRTLHSSEDSDHTQDIEVQSVDSQESTHSQSDQLISKMEIIQSGTVQITKDSVESKPEPMARDKPDSDKPEPVDFASQFKELGNVYQSYWPPKETNVPRLQPNSKILVSFKASNYDRLMKAMRKYSQLNGKRIAYLRRKGTE